MLSTISSEGIGVKDMALTLSSIRRRIWLGGISRSDLSFVYSMQFLGLTTFSSVHDDVLIPFEIRRKLIYNNNDAYIKINIPWIIFVFYQKIYKILFIYVYVNVTEERDQEG